MQQSPTPEQLILLRKYGYINADNGSTHDFVRPAVAIAHTIPHHSTLYWVTVVLFFWFVAGIYLCVLYGLYRRRNRIFHIVNDNLYEMPRSRWYANHHRR